MNRAALRIVVCAAAAIFFGWQAYRAWTEAVLPAEEPRARETFSRPAAAIPPAVPGDAVPSGLSPIVARPVFRPDRRPFQEDSPGVPQRNYEAELARYTLIGVLMAGEEKKAVVVSKGPGQDERWEVGAGDDLPGFTVKEVGIDGLVLMADGKEYTLPLYAGGPKSAGGTPIRTEVVPATSPARPQPQPAAVRPGPQTPSRSTGEAAPPVPRRTYPRRYVPGPR